MKRALWITAAVTLLTAGAGWAGTLTVHNDSDITVPETRVYKQCLGAFNAQIFGSLGPHSTPVSQTRSALTQGCAWAREIGVEPGYISCATPGIIPSDPADIRVTWTGTSASDLQCSISVTP
jgi:hypothetical protein